MWRRSFHWYLSCFCVFFGVINSIWTSSSNTFTSFPKKNSSIFVIFSCSLNFYLITIQTKNSVNTSIPLVFSCSLNFDRIFIFHAVFSLLNRYSVLQSKVLGSHVRFNRFKKCHDLLIIEQFIESKVLQKKPPQLNN